MNVRTALELGRVSNLPTTWTNVLAGTALAGGGLAMDRLGLLMLAISLFYVGGMYLNDAFDHAIDAVERPQRPIASGRVKLGTVYAWGFGMLGAGQGLVMWLGQGRLEPTLAGLGLAGAIVLYNAWHKGNPLGPLLMGLCRVLVYVTSALLITRSLNGDLAWGALALLGYLIGLTYAAKQENLNQLGSLWPLGFLALPFFTLGAYSNASGIGLLALLAVWVSYSLTFLMRTKTRQVPRAVGYLIAGICLVDGVLVGAQGMPLLAGLCVVGFGATLRFQRVIAGT